MNCSARSGLLLHLLMAISVARISPLWAGGDKKPAPEGQETPPKLAIVPTPNATLVFTWQQLQSGVAIFVQSNSDQSLRISTEVTDPQFDWLPDDPQSTSKLALTSACSDLPAHSLARLLLTLENPQANPPKEGLYRATLVVWDVTKDKNKDKIIDQPVQVQVVGAEPAVDQLAFTAWRWLPFSSWWSAGASVPLKAGDAFPTPCDKGGVVGVVRRDVGGWATVNCMSAGKGTAGRWEAGVAIQDLPYAGKYTGNLAFHKAGNDQLATLNLTVYAKDFFIWPVLVIALGIGLAIAVKRFLGVLRTTWSMRVQEAELGEAFQGSQRKFAEATRGKSYGRYSVSADIASQREAIRQHLTAIEKSWVTTLDPTNSDFKAAVTGLQASQAEIAAWAEFGPQLQTLAEALDSLQRTIDHKGIIPSGPPEFLGPTEKSLKGTGAINAAQLGAIQKAVADAITLVQSWSEVEGRANVATQVLAQLQLRTDLTDTEKQTALPGAQNQLVAAWKDLWQVRAVGDLQNIVAAGGSLDSAEIGLAQTLANHGQPFPRGSVKVADTLMMVPGDAAAQAISPQAEILLPQAATSRRIEMLNRAVRLGDAGSAVLAFVIALLTGLSTNYLGGNTSFGTVQDYVKLFLWGAGTQATLSVASSAVSSVLDKFGPGGSALN